MECLHKGTWIYSDSVIVCAESPKMRYLKFSKYIYITDLLSLLSQLYKWIIYHHLLLQKKNSLHVLHLEVLSWEQLSSRMRSFGKPSCNESLETTRMPRADFWGSDWSGRLIHETNEKLGSDQSPGCLGYIGDDKLPNYIGIIMNHYKWVKKILGIFCWMARFTDAKAKSDTSKHVSWEGVCIVPTIFQVFG